MVKSLAFMVTCMVWFVLCAQPPDALALPAGLSGETDRQTLEGSPRPYALEEVGGACGFSAVSDLRQPFYPAGSTGLSFRQPAAVGPDLFMGPLSPVRMQTCSIDPDTFCVTMSGGGSGYGLTEEWVAAPGTVPGLAASDAPNPWNPAFMLVAGLVLIGAGGLQRRLAPISRAAPAKVAQGASMPLQPGTWSERHVKAEPSLWTEAA